MTLRPDLIVRQVFRTAQPVVPASSNPAVLVGVHRQLEYQKNAGTYLGAQDNGDYFFPDLIAGSAVEPTTQEDAILQPKVYISNEYGVADITDAANFSNLDSSVAIPKFTLDEEASAVFTPATGTTGAYSASTGKFVDANADFISNGIAADDVILVNGIPAFEVDALESDSQLAVTRINHGPEDARLLLGTKNAYDVRSLTYLGTLGAGFDGFVTGGTKVGERVVFDGWNERATTAGLSFTTTDANGHRTLTSADDFTGVLMDHGDVIVIQEGTNSAMPAFIVTDPLTGSADTCEVANLTSLLSTSAVAGIGTDYPERFFYAVDPFSTAPVRAPSESGFFTAQDDGFRVFTDLNATFVTDVVQAGDWIVVFAADSGALGAAVTVSGTDTLTRADVGGSWLDDGFEVGMKILVRNSSTANDIAEYTIESVSATVLVTVETGVLANGPKTAFEVISVAMTPMFEVDSVTSETALSVADITPTLIPDARVGGPLRYSVLRPAAIAGCKSDYANISDVDATSGYRYIEWLNDAGAEVAFSGTTIPQAGDFVFNNEGVLLFEVAKAARTVTAAYTNLDIDVATRTITRSIGSWLTEGYEIGDLVQIVNSESADTGLITGGTYISIDTSGPVTITRSDPLGDWTADGIQVGMTVTITDTDTPVHNGSYLVTVVTSTVLTVSAAGSLTTTTSDNFQVSFAGNDGLYLVSNVTASALTFDVTTPPTGDNTQDTAAQIQMVALDTTAQAALVIDDADSISSIGLSIRQSDQAVYQVIRVVSETEIDVRHVVAGDEVADQEFVGLVTDITVGDTLSSVDYSIQKTVTGAALSGDVLVSYAARRTDHIDELIEVTAGTVEELAGPAVPGNPLGMAAALAVGATNVPILLAQVASDDLSGWTDAISLIQTDQVYIIAPLTQNETYLTLFQNHVALDSQPEYKRERILFQSHLFSTQITRFTMENDTDSANLIYDGTTQTLAVTHTGGLLALGVVAGDVVEGTYSGYIPGQGYTSGSISARVVSTSETGSVMTLTLLPDTTMPTTLAAGVSLTALVIKSKPLSTTQLRDAIAAYPGTIQDRRVRNIYADSALITFEDTTNEDVDGSVGFYGGGTVTSYSIGGWYMAAGFAALRSGLSPSTPLTKRSIPGIQRLVMPFTSLNDLDIILDAGNFLLTQPAGEGGGVEPVRAVTTDVTDLNYLEESVTIQIDNFARRLRAQVRPILGSTKLDQAFFDMFSMISSSVIHRIRDIEKDIKALDLIEIREDPNAADSFLASYSATPYFSASSGDITIYI